MVAIAWFSGAWPFVRAIRARVRQDRKLITLSYWRLTQPEFGESKQIWQWVGTIPKQPFLNLYIIYSCVWFSSEACLPETTYSTIYIYITHTHVFSLEEWPIPFDIWNVPVTKWYDRGSHHINTSTIGNVNSMVLSYDVWWHLQISRHLVYICLDVPQNIMPPSIIASSHLLRFIPSTPVSEGKMFQSLHPPQTMKMHSVFAISAGKKKQIRRWRGWWVILDVQWDTKPLT